MRRINQRFFNAEAASIVLAWQYHTVAQIMMHMVVVALGPIDP
jgi:hypothetical protein